MPDDISLSDLFGAGVCGTDGVLISSITSAFNFLYNPVLSWKIQCEFLTTADPVEKGRQVPAPGQVRLTGRPDLGVFPWPVQ